MDGMREVYLWYVLGIARTWYDRKIEAEKAARLAFPDEDADKRYARVGCRPFYEEV